MLKITRKTIFSVYFIAAIMAIIIPFLLLPKTTFAKINATDYERRKGPCPEKYSSMVFLVLNDGSESTKNHLFDGKNVTNGIFPGASYDLSSNTLTLTDFQRPDIRIGANGMGDDFTIRVIGDCEVESIEITGLDYTSVLGETLYWGGSLNITGTGTLTVYKKHDIENQPHGIWLLGYGSEPRLDIAKSVSLTVYGYESEPAVMISLSAGFYDKDAVTIDGKALHDVYPKYEVKGFQNEGEAILKDYWTASSEIIITGTGKEEAEKGEAVNPMKIKARTASVKYSKLKKKAQTLAISKVIKFSKKAEGKVTYAKISGNKKITVNKKTGKITIKKGLKKKSYKVKIKVSAAGNAAYQPAYKTITVKIKVR